MIKLEPGQFTVDESQSESLLCNDPLLCNKSESVVDRESPELWPEQIPGLTDYISSSPIKLESEAKIFNQNSLNKDDLDLLQELGSLTSNQLMERVKDLQCLAYKLGAEEARQMTRGKLLNVLGNQDKLLIKDP